MAPPAVLSCDGSANQQISQTCGTGSLVVHDKEEVTQVLLAPLFMTLFALNLSRKNERTVLTPNRILQAVTWDAVADSE